MLEPTSPEGKYWFDRHRMLIEVFKSLWDSGNDDLMSISQQVLDTEAQLDIAHIEEMKKGIITTDDNLVIVDKFNGQADDNGG